MKTLEPRGTFSEKIILSWTVSGTRERCERSQETGRHVVRVEGIVNSVPSFQGTTTCVVML